MLLNSIHVLEFLWSLYAAMLSTPQNACCCLVHILKGILLMDGQKHTHNIIGTTYNSTHMHNICTHRYTHVHIYTHIYTTHTMHAQNNMCMHTNPQHMHATHMTCSHAYIQDLVNAYECICATGWKGTNCETNIDECTELSPCQNGATCNVSGTFIICTCACHSM